MSALASVALGRRPTRAAVESALIVVGALATFALQPHDVRHSDGGVRYDVLNALLGRGARLSTPYSIVGPLFAAPLWLLDLLTNHGNPFWIQAYNWLLFVGGLVALAALLRRLLDPGTLRAFLLLMVFASMFPAHTRYFYGEVFTAVGVGVGVVAATLGGARTRRAGWAALILGVVNTPATLVAGGAVALARAIDARRLRSFGAPALAAALILLESWMFRGNPLVDPYRGAAGFRTVMPYSGLPGFSYPLFFGVLSVLFSFGKGLLYFAPGMWLPVRSRILGMGGERGASLFAVYAAWLCAVAGLVLVYSRWWSWYGGWYWGPRFFLLASIPASFALAVRLRREGLERSSLGANALTLAALALSLWVGIDGVVFWQDTLAPVCMANHYALEALCHYVPEFSVLWRPFVVPETIGWQGWAYIALSVLVGCYLAFPLVRRMASQVAELARDGARSGLLNLRAYRL